MVRLNTTNWNDFVSAFPQVESRLIGFDRVFDAVTKLHTVEGGQSNSFPPYNIKKLDAENYEIQIALAGFSKKELKVYTEYGKLIIEGQKETKETESEYVHQGLAQRSFTREWTLSDDVEVRDVAFKDGLLTVKLGKVVPDHHARKDYL